MLPKPRQAHLSHVDTSIAEMVAGFKQNTGRTGVDKHRKANVYEWPDGPEVGNASQDLSETTAGGPLL